MPTLDDFRRYAGLIESALAARPLTFTVEAESETALQVERGAAYAALLQNPKAVVGPMLERVLEAGLRARPAADSAWRDMEIGGHAVVDSRGHHRPVYRGLLIYSLLQSYRVAYEHLSAGDFGRWEEGLRPWVDLLEAELGAIEFPQAPVNQIPAMMGAAACDAAWMALALLVASKVFVRDAWTDLASDAFGRFIRCQQENGGFLTPTASDNPETLWYHELVILHAAASYAVQAEDRVLAAAVAKNTALHLAETQPDHASNQPWALFAFIWNPSTRPFADQLLHSAQTIGASGVTSMLLADALYCLRLFTRTQPA